MARQPDAQRKRASGRGDEVGVRAELRGSRRSFLRSSTRWPEISSRTAQARSGLHRGSLRGLRQHPAAESQGEERREAQEHAAAGRGDPDHVEWRAGDRHRAGQPAGRLRSAVQPADRLHPSSTVVVQQESSSDAVAAGLIGFTAGIAIGAAIDNDYYYGPYGWHGGGVHVQRRVGRLVRRRARMRARTGRTTARISPTSAATAPGTRRNSAPNGRRTASRQRTEAQQTRQREPSGGAGSARAARRTEAQTAAAGAGRRARARRPAATAAARSQADAGAERHEIRCVFGLFERKVGARRQPARTTQPEQLARRRRR